MFACGVSKHQLIREENKRLLAFMLTSSMQVAFLSGSSSKEILGYDLTIKSERDRYIDALSISIFRLVDTRDDAGSI